MALKKKKGKDDSSEKKRPAEEGAILNFFELSGVKFGLKSYL